MDGAERFAQLWTDYLEGDLDAAAEAELRSLLADNDELRRQAADLYQTHRLLSFAYQDDAATGAAFVRATLQCLPKSDDSFVQAVMQRMPVSVPQRWQWSWPAFRSLACGLLVGMIVTSAAWVYAGSRRTAEESVSLLVEGFEAGPVPRAAGIPLQAGVWSGDVSAIVDAEQHVAPAAGRRMLRLLRADTEGKPNPAGYVGDLYRLVDVRPQRSQIDEGSAVARLSVNFNAAAFPEHEKYQCSIFLYALDAQTATDGTTRAGGGLANDALAFSRSRRLTLDRDPQTWQPLAGELRLPPGTDFVLVRIGVGHANPGQRRPDFPGQYLDDIRLVLVRQAPLDSSERKD